MINEILICSHNNRNIDNICNHDLNSNSENNKNNV